MSTLFKKNKKPIFITHQRQQKNPKKSFPTFKMMNLNCKLLNLPTEKYLLTDNFSSAICETTSSTPLNKDDLLLCFQVLII